MSIIILSVGFGVCSIKLSLDLKRMLEDRGIKSQIQVNSFLQVLRVDSINFYINIIRIFKTFLPIPMNLNIH